MSLTTLADRPHTWSESACSSLEVRWSARHREPPLLQWSHRCCPCLPSSSFWPLRVNDLLVRLQEACVCLYRRLKPSTISPSIVTDSSSYFSEDRKGTVCCLTRYARPGRIPACITDYLASCTVAVSREGGFVLTYARRSCQPRGEVLPRILAA